MVGAVSRNDLKHLVALLDEATRRLENAEHRLDALAAAGIMSQLPARSAGPLPCPAGAALPGAPTPA
jgi:hypothetical protein